MAVLSHLAPGSLSLMEQPAPAAPWQSSFTSYEPFPLLWRHELLYNHGWEYLKHQVGT